MRAPLHCHAASSEERPDLLASLNPRLEASGSVPGKCKGQ